VGNAEQRREQLTVGVIRLALLLGQRRKNQIVGEQRSVGQRGMKPAQCRDIVRLIARLAAKQPMDAGKSPWIAACR